MSEDRVRLLLVDDHTVVRQGLKMVLGLEPDLEIVGEAGNGQEALDVIPLLKPEVVLMDLLMPVMDGVQTCYELRKNDFIYCHVFLACVAFLYDH